MFALLTLSRKLELVVARSAGVSAWQFLQPGVLVALVIGVAVDLVYNPVSAYMKQKATEIEARIFAKSAKFGSGKDIWIRQRSIDGQAIIRAESAAGAHRHPDPGRRFSASTRRRLQRADRGPAGQAP